jgi:hypothetical protein
VKSDTDAKRDDIFFAHHEEEKGQVAITTCKKFNIDLVVSISKGGEGGESLLDQTNASTATTVKTQTLVSGTYHLKKTS